MKLNKNAIGSALLAGVVLMSGVPALAAGAPADAAQPNAAVVQMTEEEVPLRLADAIDLLNGDEEVPLAGDEEVPLAGDEEVPLSSLPDTPFFNALRALLKLLGWKI